MLNKIWTKFFAKEEIEMQKEENQAVEPLVHQGTNSFQMTSYQWLTPFLCVVLVFGTLRGWAQEEALDFYVKGENLRKSKNYISAIDQYEHAIRIAPSNAKYHFGRGLAFSMLKDYDNAIASLEQTIKLQADNVLAYTLLARCYQEKGQLIKAAENLSFASKYERDTQKKLEYKTNAIKFYFEEGKQADALNQIKEAKVFAPEDPLVFYYEAAIHNAQGKYLIARNLMEKVISTIHAPDAKRDAKFYYEYGFACSKMGDHRAAKEAFQYVKSEPYLSLALRLSPEFYMLNANVCQQLNDLEEAKKLIAITLQMQPDHAQAYLMLANIAKREVDQSAAIAKFRQASMLEKDNEARANIFRNIAQLLLDNGKNIEVISAVEAAMLVYPKNYQVLWLKAVAQYRLKDFKNANLTLESLVSFTGIEPELATKAFFLMGLCYRELKNYQLAKQVFKKAEVGIFKPVAQSKIEELANLPTP